MKRIAGSIITGLASIFALTGCDNRSGPNVRQLTPAEVEEFKEKHGLSSLDDIGKPRPNRHTAARYNGKFYALEGKYDSSAGPMTDFRVGADGKTSPAPRGAYVWINAEEITEERAKEILRPKGKNGIVFGVLKSEDVPGSTWLQKHEVIEEGTQAAEQIEKLLQNPPKKQTPSYLPPPIEPR